MRAGHNEGLEAARLDVEQWVSRYQSSVEKLAEAHSSILKESEKDLIELAIGIARKVIRRVRDEDDELVLRLAQAGLDRLANKNRLILYISSADVQLTETLQDRLNAKSARGVEIQIKVDESLQRGDCLIESDYGTVDCRIVEQLDEVAGELLGDL